MRVVRNRAQREESRGMPKCRIHGRWNGGPFYPRCNALSAVYPEPDRIVFSDENIAMLAAIERPDEVLCAVHGIWADDSCCLCVQDERRRFVYGVE